MHIVLNVGKKRTSLCLLSRYPFNKEHRIGDGERNRIFQFYRTHITVHSAHTQHSSQSHSHHATFSVLTHLCWLSFTCYKNFAKWNASEKKYYMMILSCSLRPLFVG